MKAAASSGLTKNTERAYAEIIKLRINAGKKLLQPELLPNPPLASALLVANYADFLTILVSQNEKIYNKLKSRQENRLEALAKTNENSPYKRYAQAEIKLQLAMCQVFFADEVKAAWNVRSAFLLLQENQKLYPDFAPNRKSLGLLQVIIGSVPDSYQWVFKILGMRGDIKTGLNNLNQAARSSHLFQEEARIYLQFAMDWMNRKEDAGPRFMQKLANDNQDNLLYTYLAMSMLKKNKNCDAALTLFQMRPAGNDYLDFPYLHHLAADMFLYQGNYQRSLRENQYFLEHYEGKHYRKDANFKLYLASLLSDDQMPAQFYYSSISTTGTAVVEEDKYAQRFVENKTIINKQLVKARLHADGGYYQQALAALQHFKPDDTLLPQEKTEFLYRKARIYQGLGNRDSAITFYRKTIETAGNMPYYFAPNAALQLGYFAAENNDKASARYYFKKALSYPKHEYKNSIDSKAKIGLSTL